MLSVNVQNLSTWLILKYSIHGVRVRVFELRMASNLSQCSKSLDDTGQFEVKIDFEFIAGPISVVMLQIVTGSLDKTSNDI